LSYELLASTQPASHALRPLSIRLSDRQIAWLEKQAADIETRSAVIRRLIAEAIKRDGTKN